ncbi:beta-glucosidase [Chitinophaga sp. YR627]|uniref:glycoside hydrolase family 3 N-terminal domain-containing protein n=1 Tax=Chitinophaga sp. YR627 TaxID=1881041 RepID=UPI0008E775EC|nr:glycoside hydrolase family 3 N-terminal domain-containing protein [Chitinophaga sp. YR627]SFO34142.1 beta-glucosidase [Chitinophaga sp. YR627]
MKMKKFAGNRSHFMLCIAMLGLGTQAFAQVKKTSTTSVVYKNASAPVDARVKDLLKRMTLEEKVGQLCTLLGWEMYDKKGDSAGVSDKFKSVMSKRYIGSFWATLRADPWTQKTLVTGLSPKQAAIATNALQKYMMENTRLGIPLLLAEECPHGHMAIGTTVFSTSIGQASTWDPALIQEMAGAIAKEARVQGAHIGYGPVLDLVREPRWSRLEETYGEDPYLISQMGISMVKGFQGNSIGSGSNVISTLKHFTAYGSPEGGHNGGIALTGLRDLYSSYLPPFQAAVKAGALSIMASYNSIDGIPCSSNSFLLKDVLVKQWGFRGFSVSDLGGIPGVRSTHHVAATMEEAATLAINAGLDADLGGEAYGDALIKAVNNKKVTMATLDTAVAHVLRLKFTMGLFENPYVDVDVAEKTVGTAANRALSKRVAAESIVLMKNDNSLLPLQKTIKNLAVIGPNADNIYNQLGDYTAPQPQEKIVTVLEGIKAKVSPDTKVTYVKGCAIRDTAHSNISAAVAAAKQADAVVIVLGGSSARDFETTFQSTGAAEVKAAEVAVSDMESGEGYDRVSLDLMGLQSKLLESIVATGKPVVLVLIEGRPLNINWAAKNVPAIVNAWYPGQEGGNAVADVLFGDYNPAGRLPVSIPKSVGQLPVYYNYKSAARHDYVEMDAKPLYSFGHGLSYASFEYKDLQSDVQATGNTLKVTVSFKLKNTSTVAGDEVAQLYIRDDASSVVTAVKQLKKFQRIHLAPGEQKEIKFELSPDDLRLLNVDMKWVVEPGTFTMMVGASSEDIRLNGKFEVKQQVVCKY